MAALARAGFRAMAPDLRGYNRSDKPADPALYTSDHFVGDVLGLLDAVGAESAFIAGHDVGGGVAWRLVLLHPERVRGAVIFNAAHPLTWERTRPEDDADTISWFRSFFRLPLLPELVARSGDWWLLSRNLRGTSRLGTFEDPTLDVYKAAWSRDNAISTMIHVYRATSDTISEEHAEATVPVRVVWGRNDAFFPPAAATLTANLVGPEAFVEVPEASHWILLEEPDLTGREMVDFFGSL
jgi:pimeloyl-ACP methyl ester carboxylesterase